MKSTELALILVDIQFDFLETGTLPVPNATHIMPTVTELIQAVRARQGLVIATQDWHPSNHISFASNHQRKPFEQIPIESPQGEFMQTLWPDHCVQNTHGAELAFDSSNVDHVVTKGTHWRVDSYSAFADNMYLEITDLSKILHRYHVETVIIVGLAADYCVKMTCEDAIKFGFQAILVKDGTRAVDPNAMDPTMKSLQNKGVHIVQSWKDIPILVETPSPKVSPGQ